MTTDPKDAKVVDVHKLLLGGVAPRPIALVSTISSDGINNLSPFSFFNAFGANPPVVAFSPSRRGRDGSTKDTLHNLEATRECVVHAVSYDIVEQVSLASTEYPPEVDEFVKSGLSPLDSEFVRPKRVAESPFHMECKVVEIFPLGEKNGSGNLVICEVIKFHIAESVFTDGVINPNLINLVGRNSANYYTKAFDSAIFEIEKPIATLGIGIDQLPDHIKDSKTLTGNHLGKLGNIEALPSRDDVHSFVASLTDSNFEPNDYQKAFVQALNIADKAQRDSQIEQAAIKALEENDNKFAIYALISIIS
ncbi:MAG: flavin reductase family protein [Calditrichaeota bacterium]|nr:MAG: flavin reductase family protein [Calditrichota bacterium]